MIDLQASSSRDRDCSQELLMPAAGEEIFLPASSDPLIIHSQPSAPHKSARAIAIVLADQELSYFRIAQSEWQPLEHPLINLLSEENSWNHRFQTCLKLRDPRLLTGTLSRAAGASKAGGNRDFAVAGLGRGCIFSRLYQRNLVGWLARATCDILSPTLLGRGDAVRKL